MSDIDKKYSTVDLYIGVKEVAINLLALHALRYSDFFPGWMLVK